METSLDYIVAAPSIPLVVTYHDEDNLDPIIGIFKDDLLNGGDFFSMLTKYAVRRTGDYQLAEDVIAEFYSNIVAKLDSGVLDFRYPVDRKKGIHGNPKLIHWTYACVNNLCIDLYRRRNNGINGKICEGYDSDKTYSGSCEDPQETASRNEYKRIIENAMRQLSEPHQEIIKLCYLEGYKCREAAEILKIPLGTVKSRMHGAIKGLRKVLSN